MKSKYRVFGENFPPAPLLPCSPSTLSKNETALLLLGEGTYSLPAVGGGWRGLLVRPVASLRTHVDLTCNL